MQGNAQGNAQTLVGERRGASGRRGSSAFSPEGGEVMQANAEALTYEDAWRVAHERLARFATRRSRLEWREGRLLREALALCTHERLGFASFVEYVERLFGYGPRTIKEKLRVAEALELLPELSAALQQGELTCSAVRELTRVAVGETEAAWLTVAHGKTAREVEALVAGHAPGDLPDDAPDARLVRHALHFEVSAETVATFREALAKLRREAGGALDDDAALLLLARNALAAMSLSSGGGRSSYQIEVSVCRHCRRTEQLGHGTRVELPPAVAEMCDCDADRIVEGVVKPTIPRARRRQVFRRDDGRCVVPGCNHAMFVDVHHLVPRECGGDHDPENLACFCGAHHRAVHEGRLVVSGTPTSGLKFQHADGSAYGSPGVSAVHAARNSKVFGALRELGFREAESRAALRECAQQIPASATHEELLRATLAFLVGRASKSKTAA